MEPILQYFEKIRQQVPDKAAVVLRDRCLSFGELASVSARLGMTIRRKGITGRAIGVITSRTIEPLIGFIAVLYSGNYYVPVDAQLPVEKMRHIMEDAGFAAVICAPEEDPVVRNTGYAGPVIHYDELADEECGIPEDGNDLLYMVYTSGSTGKPKGVLKSQSAEIDFVEAYWGRMGFEEDDIIGNQTPFYFDAAAKDFYLMLCKGLTIVIIPTELFSLPPELIDYLNEKKVTMASWVPTVLSLVAQLNPFSMVKPETLKKVFFVGEVMPMKHLNVWRTELPDIRYVNLYGQSEIAGICSYYPVEGEYANTDTLPIGKPLDNCELYLVDQDAVVREPGHVGELHIVSKALAECYWNDAEKTAQSFIYRDFGNGPVRCFRTGDMAQYNENGDLVFAARRDNQIKHMGNRIELGEIETVAGSLAEISRCCCLYHAERKKIILFCELAPGYEKTGREIRSALKPLLSAYMLPAKVIIKEHLPINRNGKIDRQELKKEL